jgi:thiamine pyrophosphate-dependent acetolactate synthase large subunit-like protein
MPYDDPRWMGGIGMIGTKAVYNAVTHCDLLLMVGTDYPYSNFLPRKGAVIQIDERAMALGRRTPTAFGAVGSARPTLKLLLGHIAPKSDTGPAPVSWSVEHLGSRLHSGRSELVQTRCRHLHEKRPILGP